MEDVPALRRKRGTHRGAITKVDTTLRLNCKLPPRDLDITFLQKQLEQLQTHERSYTDIQQDIIGQLADDHDKEDEKAREEQLLEKLFDECVEKKLRMQGLIHLHNAYEIVDYLEEVLGNLKAEDSTQAASWSEEIHDLTDWIKELSRLLGKHVVKDSVDIKKKLQECRTRVHALKGKCLKEESRLGTPGSDTVTDSGTDARKEKRVRLPEIKLVPFDGDPLNWPAFWEQFSTVVDQNPDLSDSSKLSYLRASLKDERAAKIASPAVGNSHSYSSLVQMLRDQYEQKPLIHRKHVKALMNLHKLPSDTYDGLFDIKLEMQKHISGMERIKQYYLEYLMASIILNQMGPKLFDEWQTYVSENDEEATMENVEKFIDITLKSWTPADPTSSKTTTPFQHKSFHKKQHRAAVHLAKTEYDICEFAVEPDIHCISVLHSKIWHMTRGSRQCRG